MRLARWTLALAALAGTTEVPAQSVLLELRPRLGDTLRMRLDQTTEMIGGRTGSQPMQVTSKLRMFSRAIVEGQTATATLIFAVTDSVDLSTTDAHARKLVEDTEAQLEGRTMRLRLSPSGIVSVIDSPRGVPREVSEMVSIMPASFPTEPVAVGDTWIREMPIPASARLGVPIGGSVRSTFRFDSLSRNGDLAYVSMRGTLLTQVPSAPDKASIAGNVDGTIVVDRRRGWLSESRFLIQVRTTVETTKGVLGAPLRFRTTITQRMKVLGQGTGQR